MATINGIYRILNSSGTYDEINLRTTAAQVVEDSSKRFVTDAEKSTWNNKANASHTHTSANITDATNENTANKIVKRDASGNFSAGTITATLSGNASTATKLKTAVTINGVSFDGSKDITINATPNSHNHASNAITSMGGYVKAETVGTISTSDSLNTAIGKLEKNIEAKMDIHTHPYRPDTWVPTWSQVTSKPSTFTPSAHTHKSSEVTTMADYAKPSSTSAITTTDSLNAAIGKLEKALDGKMATHTHPYRPNTWVPAWTDVTNKPTFATVATSGSYNDLSNKPTIHTINDSTNSSLINTWSVTKIVSALGSKANTSHTHEAAQITGLGSAATRNVGTSSGQIPVLDSTGKLAAGILPSVSVNNTHTVETVSEALELACNVGDVVIITSYVQARDINVVLEEQTSRALNSGSNAFICVNKSATVFDEKFKVLMSSTDAVTHAEFSTSLNNKVDKVSGKQLSTNDYTTAEKNKLAGIAANANNYSHPASHAATMITQDSTHRFVSDSEKSNWNGKAAGNHNHDSVYRKKADLVFTDTIQITTPAS